MHMESNVTRQGVGSDVLAYCTSCKMDLNHVIVALLGDRITKVQCRTCRKDHGYRAPKGVSERAMSSSRTTSKNKRKKEVFSVEEEWTRLMEAAQSQTPVKYSIKTTFEPGVLLNHPSFGEGVVLKIHHPNKMDVVFKTEVKTLIHDKA